jgi:predicted kinase
MMKLTRSKSRNAMCRRAATVHLAQIVTTCIVLEAAIREIIGRRPGAADPKND